MLAAAHRAFLYPGRSLRVGGVLIANFRLPLSMLPCCHAAMLLMRVAAFAEIAYTMVRESRPSGSP